MKGRGACRLLWFLGFALVSLLAPCASTSSTPSTWTTPVLVTVLSTPTAETTLTPALLVRYSNPSLGFAVDHSADWRVKVLVNLIDPRAQPFPGGRKLQHWDGLTKHSTARAGRAMEPNKPALTARASFPTSVTGTEPPFAPSYR